MALSPSRRTPLPWSDSIVGLIRNTLRSSIGMIRVGLPRDKTLSGPLHRV